MPGRRPVGVLSIVQPLLDPVVGAAQRLEQIEDQHSNRMRGRLRRINAIVMLLMAVGIAFGISRYDRPGFELHFVLTGLAVLLLLLLCVVLALIDVRLTYKPRSRLHGQTRRRAGFPMESPDESRDDDHAR